MLGDAAARGSLASNNVYFYVPLYRGRLFALQLIAVSLFLDAYVFLFIDNFPVRFFFISIAYSAIIGFIPDVFFSKTRSKSSALALIMCLYLVLNHFITGLNNVNSLLLTLTIFGSYAITCIVVYEKDYDKLIKVMQIIINITVIYGIFQFFARLGSEVSDFWDIKRLLVDNNSYAPGYNWSNPIIIGGNPIWRSNAVYIEPSVFSQVIAINMVLYLRRIFHDRKITFMIVVLCIINLFALVLTFAGTGLIILFSGVLIVVLLELRNKSKKSITGVVILFAFIAFIAVFIMLSFNILDYFIERSSEFSIVNSSAFTRIGGMFEFIASVWKDNFIFGVGIGTISEHATILSSQTGKYFSSGNGFVFAAVSLGAIGLIIWLVFVYSVKEPGSMKNKNYNTLYYLMFPFLLCTPAMHSPHFWVFMFLLNVRIINTGNLSLTTIEAGEASK